MKACLLIICLLGSLYGQNSNLNYKALDYTHLLGKVEGLDDKLLQIHFQLYQGYVKNSNAVLEELSRMVASSQDRSLAYGALKRRLGWEMDGMLLHELYFSNLGGSGALSSQSSLYAQIVRDFGSFDMFKKEFISTGLMRGIGWVILYRDSNDGPLHIMWIEEHDLGHLAGGNPILVMDVWEHAYISQFGLDRAAYIDIFLKNVDWNEAIARFEKSGCPQTKK